MIWRKTASPKASISETSNIKFLQSYVFRNAPIIIFSIQKDGTITMFEGRGLEKLGLDREQVVGTNFFENFGDRPTAENIRRALTGETFSADVVTLNGRIHHTSYFPQTNDLGEVLSVLGMAQDLTEIREAEEALEISEAKWRALVQHAQDLIVAVDSELRIIMINRASFGLSLETIMGTNLLDYVKNTDRETVRRIITQVFLTGDPTETEINAIGPHDTILEYSARLSPILEKNRIDSVLLVCRDISEKIAVWKRYQALFDNSLDAILLADDQACYVDANSPASLMTGYDKDELLSKCVWDLTPLSNVEDGMKLWRDFIAAGAQNGEYEIRRKDGATLTVAYRAVANIAPGLHLSVMRDVTARKTAEKGLLEKQVLLDMAMRLAKLGSCDLNLAADRVWFSEQFKKIHGLGVDEMGLDEFMRICHPGDLRRVEKAIDDAMAGTAKYDIQHRIINQQTGETRYVQARGEVLRDLEGDPVRIIGCSQDITEIKQVETKLRESEEKYRSLIDEMMDGVLLTSPDGAVFAANQAACDMFGMTESEIVESRRDALVDTTDPRLSAGLKERAETGKFRGELNLRRKDGSIFPAEIASSIYFDTQGNPKTSMVIRDITSRRQAEDAFKKSEALFQRTFDKSPIGAAIVSLDYRFLRVNSELCRITGHEPGELVKLTFPDITYPEDLEQDLDYARDLEKGLIDQYQMDKRYIRKNGDLIWVKLSVRLIRDEKGTPLFFLPMIEDIHERKMAENALRESEQRYRLVTEHVADGVAVIQHGNIVFFNNTMERWFGQNLELDQPGEAPIITLPAELLDIVNEHRDVSDVQDSHEKNFRRQCRVRGNNLKWFEVYCATVIWKGQAAVLVTLHDITGIIHEEKALKVEAESLRFENIQLRSSMPDRYRMGGIVGKSTVMQELYEIILKASQTTANVIIQGESGTGKELVARAIHSMSVRKDKPLVPVNCGAIPESLFESEFFGYKRGAFTGAEQDKYGYVKLAHGGTLFLDEVAELTVNMQVKLLRVLESRSYTPVGSADEVRSDFRVIAASNRSLNPLVRQGLLREDFFYRVNVIPIELPPLREHKEDIFLLVDFFLRESSSGTSINDLPGHVLEAFYNYNWPGNVRELRNVLDRYLTLGTVDFNTTSIKAKPAPSNETLNLVDDNIVSTLEKYEKDLILDALNRHQWRRSETASYLGISRRSLYRRMQNLGIN